MRTEKQELLKKPTYEADIEIEARRVAMGLSSNKTMTPNENSK